MRLHMENQRIERAKQRRSAGARNSDRILELGGAAPEGGAPSREKKSKKEKLEEKKKVDDLFGAAAEGEYDHYEDQYDDFF